MKKPFQTKWLTDECFKLWLGPGNKPNEATSTINVEKMGLVPYSPILKAKNTCL